MRALLVVAHGSRREASNEEVRALAAEVARQAGQTFGAVSCAFLELAEPSIPRGLEDLAADGAQEIVVLPYFLSAGRHVVEDIPAEVAKAVLPEGVGVHLVPYVGQSEAMPSLLLGQAR